MKRATACWLVLMLAAIAGARPDAPAMLAPYRDAAWWDQHLIHGSTLPGYATADDRDVWGRLPEAVREQRIADAGALLPQPWPSLTASLLLAGAGDRRAESDYDAVNRGRYVRLQTLVIAECLENKGRFLPAIADGIWLFCEQTSWADMRHLNLQRAGRGLPDVTEDTLDIGAANIGQMLTWTDYVLGSRLDTVSPLVRPRIRHEVNRRIIVPFLTRDDYWWTGFDSNRLLNNWTPLTVAYTFTCALLLERDRDRRVQVIDRGLGMLDRYLATVPKDGACDEGPSYWLHSAGSLLIAFDLLHAATGGAFDVFADPRVAAIGRYILNAHIADDWFVNFADAPVRLRPDGARVFRFGRRINDDELRAFGAWWIQGAGLGQPVWPDNITQMLVVLEDIPHLAAQPPAVRHPRDTWYPDTQVLISRDDVARESTASGFVLAAKGGHNGERHNHNDVGQFIVYLDGRPVLIDPGVETYSNATFGPGRYDIWTLQSAYHNLPTINGTMQQAGRSFAARATRAEITDAAATLALDLAPAYPAAAGVRSWNRSVSLTRGEGVILRETFSLADHSRPTVLNLMTACEPRLSRPGEIALAPFTLSGPGAILRYNPARLTVHVETLPMKDPRLNRSWGDKLWRLQFTITGSALEGEHAIRLTRATADN